jgi:hypothetical protein
MLDSDLLVFFRRDIERVTERRIGEIIWSCLKVV